jgi:hypothetical protein
MKDDSGRPEWVETSGRAPWVALEVHGGDIKGPWPNGDRFAVVFSYDVTPKAGPMGEGH